MNFNNEMRVLIASDDSKFVKTLVDMVKSCGHKVCGFAFNGMGAIRAYHEKRPDVVLIDYSMSPMDGATVSSKIVSTYPYAKIVLMSDFLDAQEQRLLNCGALMVEQKPIDNYHLREILEQINSGCDSMSEDTQRIS